MSVPPPIAERCRLLRALHVPGRPLLLPNAWDAASARAVAAAGFPAVATTSAGVAAALGHEDGERAPAGEMLAAAARIARAVELPVTVDAEAGYGLSAEELVDGLLRAGAAGCNLEDSDHRSGGPAEPARQAARLAAVRVAASARCYDLVVNARIDRFLECRSGPGQLDLLDDALERARAYLAAGCDCVYPIFLSDREAIARFVERAGGPVNILALESAPPPATLAALGVARISYATIPFRRAMAELEHVLAEIRGSGLVAAGG
jgi:2-methylisocitrate lyase-like PEP mutase family enzyme